MPVNYPSSIDSFTDPSGTQYLSSPDHALMHTDVHTALEAIEAVLGTTTGTSIAKNLTVGKFAAPTAGGTLTTTTISSGTISGVLIGTSTFQGGTVANVLLGTSQITGGSAAAMTIGTPAITGGTANAITLGTPIIDFFTSSGTSLPTKANRGLAPTVGTLADSPGGTFTPNAAIASVFEVTLGTTVGTRTFGTPANPTDGQSITYRVKQNAGNTGTLIFNGAYLQNSSGTTALGTANTWNYYSFRYYTGGTIWHSQGVSVGIS